MNEINSRLIPTVSIKNVYVVTVSVANILVFQFFHSF